MKLILILSFLFCALVNAQSQNPNVELPDFVITGTDVISVQGAQKIQPEFVSTMSEQFFKPVFSPEELDVKDLSSPIKGDLNILDSLNYLRGKLEFGAGIYSLPTADLTYLFPFDGFVAGGHFNGENHRAHIDNSERYLINGGLNLLFTTSNENEFLPGTQFKVNGEFGSSSYKFYAVDNPLKRTLNQGNFSLGILNQMNRIFNFDLTVEDELSSISQENYSENILSLKGLAKVNFSAFNIGVSTMFRKQSLTIDDTPSSVMNSDVDNFFTIKPFGGVNISDALKVAGGISYSKSGERSYTAPFASVSLKINKFFSLFGEYSPHAEFLTSNQLFKVNHYYEPQNFYNFFYRKRNLITAAAKFEYDKYYQVNAGFKYFTSPEYPFFADSGATGRFYLSSADANNLTIFADFLFHPGPFGIFYGDIEFSNTKVDGGDYVPYHPQVKASATYSYEFAFGLIPQVGFKFTSKSFTDLPNTESIPGYFDINLKILYKVVPEFFFTVEIQNLFSDNIYYWNGYKETPLDLVAGFKYLW